MTAPETTHSTSLTTEADDASGHGGYVYGSDPAPFATAIGTPHKVTQTILFDPELNARGVYGNCLQAAFASLLGMPLDAVPHFVAFASWDTALALWLADIGLTRVVEETADWPTSGLCLVSGRSPRAVRHTVAFLDGEVWDPHPSRDGLAEVDEVWWFEPRIASQDDEADVFDEAERSDLDPCNYCPHDNTHHREDGCIYCECVAAQ